MMTLEYPVAVRWGFPKQPVQGQRVLDTKTGVVWEWYDDQQGLSGLGFWGALIGLGTSLVGGLLGKGKEKKQLEEATQIIQQQQQENEALKAQLAKEQEGLNLNKVFKRYGFFIIAGVVVVMTLRK